MVLYIAVLSTADIAKAKVIPALLSVPSVALVSVSSRDKIRAQEFVDANCPMCSFSNAGVPCSAVTVFGMTHDEVFNDTTLNAVYIPMPSRIRNEYIKRALMNNLHVYSEKPFGGTVTEFSALLNLAKESNLQFIDGTMWYHSNRTKSMELFNSNSNTTLGKVQRVSASFTWGGGGLVDQQWVQGGNGRTNPKREKMGMLGDSGHYPISAVAWAFGWELPVKVCATFVKFNALGAIIELEATLWFDGGGRAVIDTSCLLPHRSQFEIVCERGIVKVDDLVGGQGRSGKFSDAYDNPYVGSSCYTIGDYLGKDTIVNVDPCDHAQKLVEEFSRCVDSVKHGGKAELEWPKRSLVTHTIMCAIYESAMRGVGTVVELKTDDSGRKAVLQFVVGDETFDDIPTM